MKKLFVFLFVSLFIAGTALAGSGREAGQGLGDVLGQGKLDSDPHKIFRLVRYSPPSSGVEVADIATLTKESIVIWDYISDDGVTVTTTTTSPDSAVAGILATSALTPDIGQHGWTAFQSISTRNWVWLQTYGKTMVRIGAANAVVAGEAMSTSTTAGEAGHFRPSTTDAQLQGNAGFFYDDGAAAADSIECFLNID